MIRPSAYEKLTAEQLAEALIWCYGNHDGEILSEPTRARLHAATRKVRMTDEEISASLGMIANLRKALPDGCMSTWTLLDLFNFVRDLRDRYEEIGAYAPAAPEAATEEVPRG